MSGDSLPIAVAKLEAAKHAANNHLQVHAGKIETLETKTGQLEREQAVLSASLSSLHGSVETGFADVKDVIKARMEADEKREERRHDLAVQTAKDTQIWWGKAFGIVATILTMAGGGGGAYYVLADKAGPPAAVAPQPEP